MNIHEEGFIWYLYGAMTTHLSHIAFPKATYEERREYIDEKEIEIWEDWEQEKRCC